MLKRHKDVGMEVPKKHLNKAQGWFQEIYRTKAWYKHTVEHSWPILFRCKDVEEKGVGIDYAYLTF